MMTCTLGVETFYICAIEQDAYVSVKQYIQKAPDAAVV